jgi:CxxC motif-containing protein (DUF1111 family)
VAFVDTLPKPEEIMPTDATKADHAMAGKALFTNLGCAVCHLPDIGGIQGIYTDFLLHKMEDPIPGSGDGYGGPRRPDMPLPRGIPEPSEWKTAALWGVADSAPYWHDGGSPTLLSAILRHGGNAKSSREAFQKQKAEGQATLVEFLKTLKSPSDAKAVAKR